MKLGNVLQHREHKDLVVVCVATNDERSWLYLVLDSHPPYESNAGRTYVMDDSFVRKNYRPWNPQ